MKFSINALSAGSAPGILLDGLDQPQRRLAVITMTLAVCASSMNISIVNIALPNIAAALHVTPQYSVALVSSFQLAMVATLLPCSAIGEIVGYRLVYFFGLALFALSSLMVAMSTNILDATIWRLMQGLGASGILSVNTAILRFVYPKRLFGKGLGLNALVAGSSAAAGPPVAGAILSIASWHWLFLVNIPICLFALIVGVRVLPHTPRVGRRLSGISVTLHLASFGVLLTALNLVALQSEIWHGALFALAGLVVLFLYLRREAMRSVPLFFPVDLMAIRDFRLSVGASVFSFAGQMVMLTVVPFWLGGADGKSASMIGLLLTAWPAATTLTAFVSGGLSDRVAPGVLCVWGLTIFAIGVTGLAVLRPALPLLCIVLPLAVCGLGFGIFQTPNNRMILSAASPERGGSASGSLGTARMIGQSLGSAVVAMLLAVPIQTALLVSGGLTIFTTIFAIWVSARRLRARKLALS